jgi:lysophospholipase L1-like esterase
LKPNQDVKRFGHHIHINRWGMRSEDVPDTPARGTTRILFLGDSVTWGGAYEDQSTTFPYLIAGRLSGRQLGAVETLNPSCGGWAPANELGWLKEHGSYGSQIVVLVINDGDLFQPKEADASDRLIEYPSHRPVFALQELVTRYIIPRLTHKEVRDPGTGQDALDPKVAAASRQAVVDEIEAAKASRAKVIVLFTKDDPADKVRPAIPPMRKALRTAAEAHGALFVDANLTRHSQYFNGLHPNASGNEAIAEQLAPIIASVAK